MSCLEAAGVCKSVALARIEPGQVTCEVGQVCPDRCSQSSSIKMDQRLKGVVVILTITICVIRVALLNQQQCLGLLFSCTCNIVLHLLTSHKIWNTLCFSMPRASRRHRSIQQQPSRTTTGKRKWIYISTHMHDLWVTQLLNTLIQPTTVHTIVLLHNFFPHKQIFACDAHLASKAMCILARRFCTRIQ